MFDLECRDYNAKIQTSRYLTVISTPLLYQQDYVPTLSPSPFSECENSQSGDIIRSDCGPFTVEFELEDYYISKISITPLNNKETFDWFFEKRASVFSFLGKDTEAQEGSCEPQITSCGEDCTKYYCLASEGPFAMFVQGDKAKIYSIWEAIV